MALNIRTALVVDDSRLARHALGKQLQRRGIEVIAAENAAAALGCLQGELPDVVFMDLRLPDLDGFEASRRILHSFPQLPIVISSAEQCAADHARADAIGIRALLGKPVNEPALDALLQSLSGDGGSRAAAGFDIPAQPEPAAALPAARRAGADIDEQATLYVARRAAEAVAHQLVGEIAHRQSREAVRPLLDQLRDEVTAHTANLAASEAFRRQVQAVLLEHGLPRLQQALQPQLRTAAEASARAVADSLRGQLSQRYDGELVALRQQLEDLRADALGPELARLRRRLALLSAAVIVLVPAVLALAAWHYLT